jgi:DNA-binding Lrp family transcriptional regulator
MPLQLDNYDVLILKSLLKDGRKSFREISRETGITTPTVKARFSRLVNVGFIKSVSPVFNFNMVEWDGNLKPEFEKEQKIGNTTFKLIENNKNKNNNKTIFNWQQDSRLK